MRFPPVVPVSLAFFAGVWVVFLARAALPLPLLGAGAGAAAAWGARSWHAVLAAALLAGAVVGEFERRGASRCRDTWGAGARNAILQLHDAPGPRGVTRGTVVHDPGGCRGPVRIRLEAGRVRAGETFVAVGTVFGRGTFRVDHVRVLRRPVPLRFRLRRAVRARIGALYGPRAPMVEAMVLGRRDDVDPAVRDRFVAAGVAHLLAISGLHVGILAAWITLVLTPLLRPGRAWVTGAVITWLYVALLGFPASATRAAAFVSVAAVSRLRQRRPGIGAVVAVAGLVMLLVDPRSSTSVGAWLSVTAVLGTAAGQRFFRTVLAGDRERRSRTRAPVWHPAARMLAVSAGATLATAPITAFTFGQVAPIGVLTNLVAVPLAAVAVPGMFLSLIFGSPVAAGAGLALAGVEAASGLFAAVPGGHVEAPAGAGFAMGWAGLALAVGAAGWRYPRLGVAARRSLLMGVTALWISAALAFAPSPRGRLMVTFLDVGQGDAIVVRTPGGRTLLIDGGPRSAGFDAGRAVVVPALERMGVDALDVVIVSHGDADHLGGVPAVLDRFPVSLLVEPGQPVGSGLYGDLHAQVRARGVEWVAGRAGDTLHVDSLTLAFLHPTASWMRERIAPNENSLVVLLSYRGFDLLLTGDVGFPAESILVDRIRPVEVLKVGHHGSAGSTGDAWLGALAPRVAVISVGRRNRYGHPAPRVLARLAGRGVDVFRTDTGGAVTIESDGRYFAVRQGSPSIPERLRCLVSISSRSNGSSSNGNGCSRKRPVT